VLNKLFNNEYNKIYMEELINRLEICITKIQNTNVDMDKYLKLNNIITKLEKYIIPTKLNKNKYNNINKDFTNMIMPYYMLYLINYS
jgi:hypothetical protein